MEKKIISEAGDWSKWSAEHKEGLAAAKSNRQVGEKIVFENAEFCVWSIHLPAGQSLPFHKHAQRYFWTALCAGKSRSYYNNGAIIESEYEPGSTKYFDDLSDSNYFIHNLENIGNTKLVFTTVEFFT